MQRVLRATRLAMLTAVLSAAAGCYDVPKPECGFRCGPNGSCPEDYTCSERDGRCHLNGTPDTLVCATLDAGIDARPDAPVVDAAGATAR